MSFLDEVAVAILRFFEGRATDWDVNRVPQPARRPIMSQRMAELRRKFQRSR